MDQNQIRLTEQKSQGKQVQATGLSRHVMGLGQITEAAHKQQANNSASNNKTNQS
jgi:hypothetical protein